ncbi:DUF2510 domain-containing protein [Actinomadura yumaensis]|uniref:DUF2510 domain-containing protein n=1 Tax=Actinomadura yumaensis TaxID=111807 RepID=UPI0036170412
MRPVVPRVPGRYDAVRRSGRRVSGTPCERRQTLSRPGWYPDPYGTGSLRWWDGRTWTDHLNPEPPRGPGRRGGGSRTARRAGGARPSPPSTRPCGGCCCTPTSRPSRTGTPRSRGRTWSGWRTGPRTCRPVTATAPASSGSSRWDGTRSRAGRASRWCWSPPPRRSATPSRSGCGSSSCAAPRPRRG